MYVYIYIYIYIYISVEIQICNVLQALSQGLKSLPHYQFGNTFLVLHGFKLCPHTLRGAILHK